MSKLPPLLEKELVDAIVRAVHPRKIILFGSYAYGEPEEGSDIDLLVVKKQVGSKTRESAELWKALASLPYPKDIVVSSEAEFDFYRKEAGSLFRTASEKGILLYEG